MNRIEFIEKLQRALAGGLDSRQVTENVRYYQEYIDMEIRKGRRESEILTSLGDPRLLAKSIIEANKRAGRSEGSNLNYDEEVADSGSRQKSTYTYHYDTDRKRDAREDDMTGTGRVFRVPGWLILLIITVVVLLIIGVALSLISVMAPILIPVLVIMLLVKLFQNNK